MVCYYTAAKAPTTAVRRRFITLSFSGAGHLLPYHLGCASALLRRQSRDAVAVAASDLRSVEASSRTLSGEGVVLPPIEAVSGSSSGAIAAVALARLPDRVDELADRFIDEGGAALRILREMLHEQERRDSTARGGSAKAEVDVGAGRRGGAMARSPALHVAATRCSDGSLHLFSFPRDNRTFRTISAGWNTDRVLRCVEASCRIPASFHPVDVTPGWFGRRSGSSYPDEEGVLVDGEAYADGGIAAPAPSTPRDGEDGALRVIVSPISGSVPADGGDAMRISPADSSWNLLPMEVRCNGGFRVRPSVQNIRAMRISLGAASGEELRDWFELGRLDGEKAAETLSAMRLGIR